MKKIKLIVVSVVALSLAFALASCGGNAETSGSLSASSSATASSSSSSGSSSVVTESSSAVVSSQKGASIRINTDGMGVIAWAYEGAEPEFDADIPQQSAVINDASGQTISIEAQDYDEYEGWHFVKWTKDGIDFSVDNRIDVLVDGDAEYIAVFELSGE